MRFYVKVADAIAGVGYSRGYWTRRGAVKAAQDLSVEFGSAVWIHTAEERAAYERGSDE